MLSSSAARRQRGGQNTRFPTGVKPTARSSGRWPREVIRPAAAVQTTSRVPPYEEISP